MAKHPDDFDLYLLSTYDDSTGEFFNEVRLLTREKMFKNKSVNVHQFTMVPRPDVPRSKFKIQKAHKTTMDSGWLVPIYLDEVLPGDTFNVRMTAFARLSTPLFPTMDNLHLDSFSFCA